MQPVGSAHEVVEESRHNDQEEISRDRSRRSTKLHFGSPKHSKFLTLGKPYPKEELQGKSVN